MDCLNHEFPMETLPMKDTLGNTNSEENSTPLVVDPQSLEGVASAYRYKLTFKNESLVGATFHFQENNDVFSFNAVDKKRALKKEEWPTTGSNMDPNLYEVKVQLMAGNVEIQNCDGCASWKEKTRKPFLVLTPTGERCVHYEKHPFLLLIFRCCPKFHSCNKQFRLVLTLTSRSGEIYRSEVNIYRKKMVSSKKRKCQTPTNNNNNSTNSCTIEPPLKVPTSVVKPLLSNPLPISSPPLLSKTQFARENLENNFPSCYSAKQIQMPLQLMVSSQLMYQLLYCDGSKTSHLTSENCCGTSEFSESVPKIPVMKKHEVYHNYRDTPVLIKQELKLEEPKLPSLFLQNNKEKFTPAPAPVPWKFDIYRPLPLEPAYHDINSDEKWLDSVFSEFNGGSCSLPRTLDDISALLDLPDNLPTVNLEEQF